MDSASGITAETNASGGGDSTAQGDVKSAVKNTAPDKRTTRRTSDSTSIKGSRGLVAIRGNGQGFQSPNQAVKSKRRIRQELERLGHGVSAISKRTIVCERRVTMRTSQLRFIRQQGFTTEDSDECLYPALMLQP